MAYDLDVLGFLASAQPTHCYQSFTEANLDNLRSAGYQHTFKSVEEGVALYMQWLNA